MYHLYIDAIIDVVLKFGKLLHTRSKKENGIMPWSLHDGYRSSMKIDT